MILNNIIKITILISLTILSGNNSFAKVYKLYFLGGQSNMEGYGYSNQLPSELDREVKSVMVFTGNSEKDSVEVDGKGVWATLRPVFGVGFKSDGKTNFDSNRFGPEFTFGIKMAELNPDENIAIIKYAKGGSSIDIPAAWIFGCWDPDFNNANGINQYDHFLATLRNAFAIKDIDGDGEDDRLIPAGIVWMQGESDANLLQSAKKYEKNLKRIIDLIRASLRVDDLPVVIGRISDSHTGKNDCGKVWKYGNVVRAEQENFVKKDVNATLVTTTDNYKYSDTWHYDTEGYIDFGKQCAEEMFKLENK
jgi:hypothetical protein